MSEYKKEKLEHPQSQLRFILMASINVCAKCNVSAVLKLYLSFLILL